MIVSKRVYWVDLNRFDQKPDKSTWLEVSESLIERGYDVSILTGFGKEPYNSAKYKVKVVTLGAINIAGLFRYSLLVRVALWLLIKVQKSDIVILPPGGMYVAPFLRLCGVKNLHLDIRTLPVEVHTLWDKLDVLLFWTIPIKSFLRCMQGFSFITDPLRKAMSQEFKVDFQDYVIWQSGVNSELFHASYGCAEKNVADKFILFYHGTISPNRGLEQVIKGLARLDDQRRMRIEFVIVGSGPGYKKLLALAEREGVSERVNLVGLIPYEEVPERIARADVCICPLPNRPEWMVSSPIKVFEYLASGKPVILTPILAHKEVVEGKEFVVWTNGYEPEDFRSAITFAYENKNNLARAAALAPPFVKDHYDWKAHGERLSKYFDEKYQIQ